MQINIANHECTICWDGVYYFALSDYPNISAWELKKLLDVKKGESLFVHKLAVTKAARKSGVADALMETFKEQGAIRGAKTLRLDTHALRPKLRAFYERHGFVFVEVKVFKGDRHTAFYAHTLPDCQTKNGYDILYLAYFFDSSTP